MIIFGLGSALRYATGSKYARCEVESDKALSQIKRGTQEGAGGTLLRGRRHTRRFSTIYISVNAVTCFCTSAARKHSCMATFHSFLSVAVNPRFKAPDTRRCLIRLCFRGSKDSFFSGTSMHGTFYMNFSSLFYRFPVFVSCLSCLPVCLSVCLYVCLSVPTSVSLSLFLLSVSLFGRCAYSRSPSTMPAAVSAPVTKVSTLSNGAKVITRESGQLVRRKAATTFASTKIVEPLNKYRLRSVKLRQWRATRPLPPPLFRIKTLHRTHHLLFFVSQPPPAPFLCPRLLVVAPKTANCKQLNAGIFYCCIVAFI